MNFSSNNLLFREAQKVDIETIVNIHNSNVISKQFDFKNQGFLLEKIDHNVVMNKINNLTEKYFVTTNKTNSVLGYVALSNKIDGKILSKVEWGKNHSYKSILPDRHIYIAVLAIRPDIFGCGVGQYMYMHLYSKYPNYIITAFVAIKPYMNKRSYDFHLKQGFHIIGHYKDEYFCGLKNYESKLFFKTI